MSPGQWFLHRTPGPEGLDATHGDGGRLDLLLCKVLRHGAGKKKGACGTWSFDRFSRGVMPIYALHWQLVHYAYYTGRMGGVGAPIQTSLY